jgi:hypothetical protein
MGFQVILIWHWGCLNFWNRSVEKILIIPIMGHESGVDGIVNAMVRDYVYISLGVKCRGHPEIKQVHRFTAVILAWG